MNKRNDLQVCALARADVHGWPGTDEAQLVAAGTVQYVPLSVLLSDASETDLHFTAYCLPDKPVRLNNGAERLPGGVPMTLLVFDVDAPKDERADGKASLAWRESQQPKIDALLAEQSVYVYQTRGGYRILAMLEEPFIVDSLETAKAWSDQYITIGAWLSLKFQIQVDPRCRNWTRLYRGPHALRKTETSVEAEPGISYGESGGAWDLSSVDVEGALAQLDELAEEHKEWAEAKRSLESPALLTLENRVVPTLSSSATLPGQYDVLVDALAPHVAKVGEGGGRHSLYLALSGVLLDRGVAGEALPQVIQDLSVRSGIDDARLTQDRIATAKTTVARAAAGAPHTRIGTLAALYPEIAQVLDVVLPPKRSKSEEAILRAFCKPKADLPTPSLGLGDDMSVARAVITKLEDRGTQIVFAREQFWYCENEGIWVEKGQIPLELAIHEFSGTPIGEKGIFRADSNRVVGVVKRVMALRSVPNFFESAPDGLAFENGFLSLANQQLHFGEVDAACRVTAQLPFSYDVTATAPRWIQFLHEVFDGEEDVEETIEFLQQFLGACLFGIATRYQKCVVLTGSGENGKSVYLKVVSELFPGKFRSRIPLHKLNDQHYIAMLAGVRLNLVAETPKIDLDRTEMFKAVVAGDAVYGRWLYQKPFEFAPVAGHMFSCNALPGTSDQSEGFWRRFVPVSFNRVFRKEEQDPLLDKKIIAKEMPGITNWALEGARKLLAKGSFTIPSSTERTKKEWRHEADQVSQFVEARIEVVADSDHCETGATVYAAYKEWAIESGHKLLANNSFASRMTALGIRKKHTSTGNAWCVKLKGGHVGMAFRTLPGGKV